MLNGVNTMDKRTDATRTRIGVAKRGGAVDFIVKPFDRAKMIAKVAAAAGREAAPCH